MTNLPDKSAPADYFTAQVKLMFNLKLVISFLLIMSLAEILSAQTTDVSPKDTSCSAKSAKIMILGTYHMDNPGKDAINIEADDVLSAKRQREISELVENIVRYKPTKIAIEAPYRSTYWTTHYKKFLAGEDKLGRNEIEQIGFQLAKKLNHPTLYPIDFPMWMNGLLPSETEEPKVKAVQPAKPATATPEEAPLPAHLAKLKEMMRTSTVAETLRYVNTEQYSLADHAAYMEMLMPTNEVAIYSRTDLVTNWYKRNLRMFTNINRITEFPDDRILLIVGSGHGKILRDFASDAPQYCLVEAATYLK
jgi:hypothetical protein